MKKLLFVATRQFWPASTGKEVTLFYNCKGLHEKYGYEIYLFCFADKKADTNRPKPDFIKEVKYVSAPPISKTLFSILKNSFFVNRWPLQSSLFYSSKISDELNQYYNEVDPDVVFIDMVRLVPYAEQLPRREKKRILVEDDLLDKRYARQMKTDGNANIGGYYSASMGGVVSRITGSKLIKNRILKLEIKRLNQYEKRLVSLFDYITFISPIETREFNAIHNTTKGITLTMGANIGYCSGGEPEQHFDNSMSIVGNFTYAPNADSLEWVAHEVIPRLDNSISYHVIGKCSEAMQNTIQDGRIKFYGYLEDPRTIIKATDIYFAPILYGTGIKTKVVEAMAMGMVVVTNSIGAEGLDVKNGEELFICDSVEELVFCVQNILKDNGKRSKISQQARKYAVENHDWERVYDAFGAMGL